MKVGTEDKKKLGILAVVGVMALGAIFYLYSELSTPSAPPPAAPVVVTAPARPAQQSAAQPIAPTGSIANAVTKADTTTGAEKLDPTLHMEAMLVTESLVYSGNGRNIFSANSAPEVIIPKAVASVRTSKSISSARIATGPPAPPPIDLKFFGTETNEKGDRRAFLLHGEDVFLVASGDIVQRRYRVVRIDAHSIVIDDIANNNQQTLPLLAN